MHIPFILKCLWACPTQPHWKNPFWNARVYDGQTRNDFKKGDFALFLYKLRVIKKLNYDDDDGRGYYIGYLDDD